MFHFVYFAVLIFLFVWRVSHWRSKKLGYFLCTKSGSFSLDSF
ncbi:hypothetical protein NP493_659g01000 [Ridgeia piscesae]|uniref:Uncharacterized protein n=1 Tax=Ridgeia piscesae TaxID=27915 RepID=A0AAD9KRT6_RIDPI|nr:hypothetical protein NP493_659g01000 [Ridgeia piscesae]